MKTYCRACGNEIDPRASLCPGCGVRQRIGSSKDRVTAILLAFLFGGIGVHKFYLGQFGQGLLYFIFCWTFIPAFIAIVEVFYFMAIGDEKFDELYN